MAAAKSRPRPRPGVLDIAPYVPGTSALPGAHPVIKLSATAARASGVTSVPFGACVGSISSANALNAAR